jgi:hypothetical protein
VTGSKSDLFLPANGCPRPPLVIVEGPTDAAAALDLGYDVIGRPACVGCEDTIVAAVRHSAHVDTVLVVDADEPR